MDARPECVGSEIKAGGDGEDESTVRTASPQRTGVDRYRWESSKTRCQPFDVEREPRTVRQPDYI